MIAGLLFIGGCSADIGNVPELPTTTTANHTQTTETSPTTIESVRRYID